jgi:molybdate transport system permease protein
MAIVAHPRQAWWVVAGLPLVLFLTLPLAALLGAVPWPHVPALITDPAVRSALSVSLQTSLVAVGLGLAGGLPLAYALAWIPFPGRRLVDTLIDLPMVLPPAVAGLALLLTVGRRGLLGPWLDSLGLSVAFSPAAVVLAQLFIAVPFIVRTMAIGFAQIDREVLDAAAVDGADGWQRWRHVGLPLAWRSILGGTLMGWARALGEFGATIIVAGNLPGLTQTMPLAIYVGFEFDQGVALTLATLLLALALIVLLAVRVWLPLTAPARH